MYLPYIFGNMCAVFFCLVADFTSCSHWHVQLYPFFGSCIFPNQSFIVGLSFPQTIKERLIVALGRSQESELKQSIRSFKVYSDILSGKSNKSIAKAKHSCVSLAVMALRKTPSIRCLHSLGVCTPFPHRHKRVSSRGAYPAWDAATLRQKIVFEPRFAPSGG